MEGLINDTTGKTLAGEEQYPVSGSNTQSTHHVSQVNGYRLSAIIPYINCLSARGLPRTPIPSEVSEQMWAATGQLAQSYSEIPHLRLLSQKVGSE